MGGRWLTCEDRLQDINTHCLNEFRRHWLCLENGNQQLWQCRPEEWRLNKCVYENLVSQPRSSRPSALKPVSPQEDDLFPQIQSASHSTLTTQLTPHRNSKRLSPTSPRPRPPSTSAPARSSPTSPSLARRSPSWRPRRTPRRASHRGMPRVPRRLENRRLICYCVIRGGSGRDEGREGGRWGMYIGPVGADLNRMLVAKPQWACFLCEEWDAGWIF